MTIVSIDPGFERVGIAVLTRATPKDRVVYSDCFRTSAHEPFPERLHAIGEEFGRVVRTYQPDSCALESLFFNSNQKTALQVAEVRGMLLYETIRHGLTLYEYTPLQIKMALTGYGRSTKQQIMAMVPQLVVLEHQAKRLDDEFDAIAVGITCLASTRSIQP